MFDIREPALHSTELSPGQCVGGWMTFQAPLATLR
jgi:hypothetical protein